MCPENNRKINVFITGGAGFIGSALVPLLIQEGYSVTVYDLFNFGAESLFSCSFSEDLKLIQGDIRDEEFLRQSMQHADYVIHLAAIVGYPACSKNPKLATSTNVDGTKNVVNNLKPGQRLIFASTGSCYGAIPDGFCNEETPLNPLSLYAVNKADCEAMIKESGCGGVILRLATIFGVAQRLRLDLLINDLVYKAIHEKKFEVYEAHFKRTFLHIKDVARAFLFAMENYEVMSGEVFNVGGDALNFTKWEICEFIQKNVPSCEISQSTNGSDADKRDYQVSYEKIKRIGFEPQITLQQGIQELVKVLPHVSQNFLTVTKNA